jgi:hypothetical protein
MISIIQTYLQIMNRIFSRPHVEELVAFVPKRATRSHHDMEPLLAATAIVVAGLCIFSPDWYLGIALAVSAVLLILRKARII